MRRQIKIRPTITNRSNESLERYLSEISREPRISIEEEVELGRRAKNGDEAAVERLVRANLRFVVSVAKQYQGQGISLIDLINEGNLGLIQAAHRFDPLGYYREEPIDQITPESDVRHTKDSPLLQSVCAGQ